jgi:hypothetical protein
LLPLVLSVILAAILLPIEIFAAIATQDLLCDMSNTADHDTEHFGHQAARMSQQTESQNTHTHGTEQNQTAASRRREQVRSCHGRVSEEEERLR